MENLGDLVKAEIVDTLPGQVYKFQAIITSNPLRGEEAYVAYKGDPKEVKNGKILVRIGKPYVDKKIESSRPLSTNFITSSTEELSDYLPFDTAVNEELSDYLPFDTAVFFGIWTKEMMKLTFKTPTIKKFTKFYFPGRVNHVLHFGLGREVLKETGKVIVLEDKIISFSLYKNQKNEVMFHSNNNKEAPVTVGEYFNNSEKRESIEYRIRSSISALERYLTRHRALIKNKKISPTSPMVISCDEDLLNSLNLRDLVEYHGLILVEMEPQNRKPHNWKPHNWDHQYAEPQINLNEHVLSYR